jgi:hypothetical protein
MLSNNDFFPAELPGRDVLGEGADTGRGESWPRSQPSHLGGYQAHEGRPHFYLSREI